MLKNLTESGVAADTSSGPLFAKKLRVNGTPKDAAPEIITVNIHYMSAYNTILKFYPQQ